MNIRNKFITVMFGLLSVVPTKAQKTAEVVLHAPIVERVTEDTVKVKNKISKDISLRTFQFLNGNNLTAFGFGFGKNGKRTSAYISPLAGQDFANKKPWIGAFGFLDRSYSKNSNKKVWLSQELYGEFSKEKGGFDSKVAYTPIKLNANISPKVNVSFDPRVAVHYDGHKFNKPQVETLTTFFVPINKRMSAYALFQTYDTANLFKKGAYNNMGVNGGLVYTFRH